MSADIAELIAAPEGKTIEFKRDLSSLKQIMKTVVAFANTAGGTLIIGREDEGRVVGIEDPLSAEEKLSCGRARSHILAGAKPAPEGPAIHRVASPWINGGNPCD